MSGSADALTAFAAALGPALVRAAGADGRTAVPVSLSLDLAGVAANEEVAVEARVDRATRTLVFASAEARGADGRLLAAASAVFRVVGGDGAEATA